MGWLILNIDGAFWKDSRLRSFCTKMFAVRDGFRLAANEGMQSIVMETNSMIVVKILNKALEPSWNLINVIRDV